MAPRPADRLASRPGPAPLRPPVGWPQGGGLPALALLLTVAGCGGTNGDGPADAAAASPDLTPPPPICKAPATPPAPLFGDITTVVLPHAGSPSTAPTANTLRAADLDGDGYPDLMTQGGDGYPKAAMTAAIGDFTREAADRRTRFIYMNRPDPSDPSGRKRIFVDATDDSRVLATRDGMGGYAWGAGSIGDIDNDGDSDIVVGPGDPGDNNTGRPPSDPGVAMLNDGKGHFTLAPQGGDLEQNATGFASATATLFDFDADGVLDFLPGTFVYPPPNFLPPMLLKGLGNGQFTDVTEKFGIVTNCTATNDAAPTCPPMYGLSACDLDMDGDQDILFAAYGREPNQVWRNDGDHFTEIGVETGIAYDDRMDYTTDESYRCYCMNRCGKGCEKMPAPPPTNAGICAGFGLTLCTGIKNGKGTCTLRDCNGAPIACASDADCPGDGRGWQPGYSDKPWSLGGNNYSLACGDFDNDGDIDIMTSTIKHADVGDVADPSELIINNTPPGMPLTKFSRPGGKVTGIDRSAGEVGLNWNEGDLTATMVDVDNDGLKDVYLCSSDYPGDHGWLFHQKADHSFENATSSAKLGQLEAHGIAWFDFDKDGDLDVAIGTSTFRGGAAHSTLKVYENLTGQDNNWVQIQLVGLGAGHTNRSAIGAVIKVTAGGVTRMVEVSGAHSASATQNELVQTIGLGASCVIDKVEVRWLDGKRTTQTFTGVQANYRVRLTEGSPLVEYIQ